MFLPDILAKAGDEKTSNACNLLIDCHCPPQVFRTSMSCPLWRTRPDCLRTTPERILEESAAAPLARPWCATHRRWPGPNLLGVLGHRVAGDATLTTRPCCARPAKPAIPGTPRVLIAFMGIRKRCIRACGWAGTVSGRRLIGLPWWSGSLLPARERAERSEMGSRDTVLHGSVAWRQCDLLAGKRHDLLPYPGPPRPALSQIYRSL
jgi:hypothetical protein